MKQTSDVSLKEKPKNINKIENMAWILTGFLREREHELQWRHDKALGTRWYWGKMVTMKKSIYLLHFWLILIRIRIWKLWSWLLGCGVLSGGIFNFNAHSSCPSSHLRIWKFENVGQQGDSTPYFYIAHIPFIDIDEEINQYLSQKCRQDPTHMIFG